MIELGQRVVRSPAFPGPGSPGQGDRNERDGTVVYIHPRRRFYIVAFALPGGTVREAFRFQGGDV